MIFLFDKLANNIRTVIRIVRLTKEKDKVSHINISWDKEKFKG